MSVACFHCGAPADATGEWRRVTVDGASRPVCSDACADIAQLIDARGLAGFYRFRDGPTAAANAADTQAARWAGYDRDRLQREFVTSLPDGGREAQLLVQGVRCAACAWLIESALRALPGVREVRVDPLTTRTTLRWDPARIRLSELLAQLARLGYTPFPFTEDAADRAAVLERRAALKRLIIAGLGMMQVMSFAVAIYAGAWRDPEIQDFLRLISLLVATPVVFYAGAPFFAGAWRRLRAGALGMDVPVALAIGGAWTASVWNTLAGTGEVYFDSATMFVFFLSAARFLEMAGRHRALSLTGILARHLPRVATRERDGTLEDVGVMELEPGDTVLVQPGRAIPVDGRLQDGRARVDESLLTGESRPVDKQAGDPVVAGSLNQDAAVRVTVERVGASTVMAQIARLTGDAGTRKPRVVELADRIASWFVAAVLAGAGVVGLVWWQIDPARAFEVVLAVLVVTCPCALALATPAAFTVATAALARRGFMVRRAGAIQALAQVTDIVFDKTGTLTGHEAGILEVETLGPLPAEAALGIAAALEAQSEHPLARAFPRPPAGLRATSVRAVPGAGLEGEIDGRAWRIGTPGFASSLAAGRPAGEAASGLAGSVYLGSADGLIARFELAEQLRPQTAATLAALRGLGLALHVASGDQPEAVQPLAARLGIADWHARLQPAGKLALARDLQAAGRRVAMLGDGINDSPVLAGADVSIAMGTGTSLAQHSADCVLMRPTLAPLATAVLTARRTLGIVRQNLAWAALYNLAALPLAATGVLAPWMAALGMSASSLLVTANALRLGRLPPDAPVTPEPEPAAAAPAPCCRRAAGAAP